MRAVVFEGLNDDPISSSILYVWTTLSLARRRVGFFASLLFATVKQIQAWLRDYTTQAKVQRGPYFSANFKRLLN